MCCHILLSTCQASPRMLCPSGPRNSRMMQTDWRGSQRGGPWRWSKGWRSCPMRKDCRSWVFSPLRREGSGQTPSQYSTVLEGQLQKWLRLQLHKEPQRGQGQPEQVAPGEISSQYKKKIFYSENSQSLKQYPQGCVESLLLEVFKMQLDRVLDNLI